MPAPLQSPNFGLLAVHDPLLVRLAGQAETYVFSDPETALFKVRPWVEILAKQIAGTARLSDATGVRPLLQRLVSERAAKVEGQKRGTRYVAT